ncbi:hypothetical protein BJ508DRAFT_165199 [Ascobolus immersus RN42]|uniref:Uncharacterized protein n=1 Tax=Ascobolus immersus RN42 TaxID=1160509 RepID=A0A3N4HYZ7_ASCIM|nr:hypothetical protein BJ508DRAFT_165199 [Ascobolus immersus RN42]
MEKYGKPYVYHTVDRFIRLTETRRLTGSRNPSGSENATLPPAGYEYFKLADEQDCGASHWQNQHSYYDMRAASDAKQFNGNVGFKPGEDTGSAHVYTDVEATGESRQINGNIGDDFPEDFWN